MIIKAQMWFWTIVWFLCMLIILPFVILARVFKPAEYLLLLMTPFGAVAGYAYRRMFKDYYGSAK